MSESKRQYEALKFTFGPKDIQELGQALARETQNVYDLEWARVVLAGARGKRA